MLKVTLNRSLDGDYRGWLNSSYDGRKTARNWTIAICHNPDAIPQHVTQSAHRIDLGGAVSAMPFKSAVQAPEVGEVGARGPLSEVQGQPMG